MKKTADIWKRELYRELMRQICIIPVWLGFVCFFLGLIGVAVAFWPGMSLVIKILAFFVAVVLLMIFVWVDTARTVVKSRLR